MKRSHVISFGGAFRSLSLLLAEMKADRINAYAAESAFFVILSAIPLVTLTVTIAGIVIPESVSAYIHRLADLVPCILGDYLETEFLSFSEYPAPAPLSISAFAAMWGASRGVRAVRRGVRSVWGQDGGAAISEIAIGLLFTASFILLIVALLVFLVFGDSLSALLSARSAAVGGVFDLLVTMSPVFMLVMLTLFFALMLRAFTPSEAKMDRLRCHLPGAAVASSGWTLYSYIFSVFVSDFSNLPHIYGSAAAIMVLMLWLYMIMYILLFGAEVNKFFIERSPAR